MEMIELGKPRMFSMKTGKEVHQCWKCGKVVEDCTCGHIEGENDE